MTKEDQHIVACLAAKARDNGPPMAFAQVASAGLWAMDHSQAIKAALEKSMRNLPQGIISSFEKALDAMPKDLK